MFPWARASACWKASLHERSASAMLSAPAATDCTGGATTGSVLPPCLDATCTHGRNAGLWGQVRLWGHVSVAQGTAALTKIKAPRPQRPVRRMANGLCKRGAICAVKPTCEIFEIDQIEIAFFPLHEASMPWSQPKKSNVSSIFQNFFLPLKCGFLRYKICGCVVVFGCFP